MSQAIQLAGGISSYVAYQLPVGTINKLTLQYDMKIDSGNSANVMVLDDNKSNNNWRGAAAAGNTSTDVRAWGLEINGVPVSATTRDALRSLLPVDEWFTLKYTDLRNGPNDTTTTNWPNGALIFFGTYDNSPSYCYPAQVRNFKVDEGATGSWDHESEIGDTSPFFRSGITVVPGPVTFLPAWAAHATQVCQ